MSDDKKDKPTLVTLKQPSTEMQKILASLEREMPEMLASQREMAKLLRGKYIALIEQGFTHKDALELCKNLEW